MSKTPDTVGFYARIGTAGPAVLDPATREPFTVRIPDVGTEVLVHHGFGYALAKLTEVKGPKATAESGELMFPLDYWLDERRCWTCSMALDKRALASMQF